MAKDVIIVLALYHKNIAVKVKMNVEDNLDSDNFYDFWQLSGCAVVLCHNVRHISKITTGEHLKTPLKCSIIYGLTYLQEFKTHLKFNLFVGRLNGLSHGFRVHAVFQKTMR